MLTERNGDAQTPPDWQSGSPSRRPYRRGESHARRRGASPSSPGWRPREATARLVVVGNPFPQGSPLGGMVSSPAPMPPGNPHQRRPLRADVRGHRRPMAALGRGGRRQGRAIPRRNRLHALTRRGHQLPCRRPSQPGPPARSIRRRRVGPSGDRRVVARTGSPSLMSTTASSRELEVWAEAQTLRVALIAPPTAAVPPASLGGLDQVRWLAEGLAERGHQVALIGAGLGGMATGGYPVIDTDPTSGQRASAEIVERLHAEQAGKVLEQLGDADVVSDHTRTGWLPAAGQGLHARTVQTSYRPLVGVWEPAPQVAGHLGWVAVSEHQRRNAPDIPWVEVIHPAIPVGEHPLKRSHRGPCVYLGPLLQSHGAGLALEAAHKAGRSIVLAGTQPGARAIAYTEEIVEAMAYGTPVVTTVDTVGAELVSHGVSGQVVNDPILLAAAIDRTDQLDPRRIRAHAASQFDLVGMVSAYEWLLTKLTQHARLQASGSKGASGADALALAAMPTPDDPTHA